MISPPIIHPFRCSNDTLSAVEQSSFDFRKSVQFRVSRGIPYNHVAVHAHLLHTYTRVHVSVMMVVMMVMMIVMMMMTIIVMMIVMMIGGDARSSTDGDTRTDSGTGTRTSRSSERPSAWAVARLGNARRQSTTTSARKLKR